MLYFEEVFIHINAREFSLGQLQPSVFKMELLAKVVYCVTFLLLTICKPAISKHISLVLLNTSADYQDFKTYTEAPNVIGKDTLGKQKMDSNRNESPQEWRKCLGSKQVVCDPQQIFSEQKSKLYYFCPA